MDRRSLLALAASVPLAACGDGIDTADWTEQVKLHDGRMIQVSRQARAMHGGFPNSTRGRDLDFALTCEPMQVTWRGPWNRLPASFDVFDDVPHLVLFIADPPSCATKVPTDYAAQFLRRESNQWIDVRQDQFPVERALMNLYQGYWGRSTDDDARGLVTWQLKAERDGFDPERPHTVKAYFEKHNEYCGHLHR